LRALIRRSAGNAHPDIEISDIKLDTRAKTVTKGGQAVTLTAREYSILEYLAQHRGELITRTELYEHLFDENDSTMSNLLDVHVSNLRKKLGAAGKQVQTARGVGFKLVE
jgi:two-component system OmpR family response regulator